MKSLIALALIAAATFAPDQPELQPGTAFDAPDDVADKLVADGLAKLAEAAPAKAAKAVRVRLLVASEHGKPNDVRELPAEVAKQLVKSGDADDDKAAVAYAAGLPQNQKKT
jgi:hypothetical protein